MKCDFPSLLALLPAKIRSQTEIYEANAEEIRLRAGKVPMVKMSDGYRRLKGCVSEEDLRFVVNTASRYSPWAAGTVADGYITAKGGHRIGLCGEAVTQGGQIRMVDHLSSLNIRVARDIDGIGDGIPVSGNLLILGEPGSGKTTLLRELIRKRSCRYSIAVVDEREELFPRGFDRGEMTDVLTGCRKGEGTQMLLRTMGPACIAMDEITSREDANALMACVGCGVELMATAHGNGLEDLRRRRIYSELMEQGIFDWVILLRRDKSWHIERMDGG